MKRVVLFLIWIYQRLISPLKPSTCRFFPSCSEYGRVALTKHGLLLGGWYTLLRILKCHPFHPGGVDEVPKKQCR